MSFLDTMYKKLNKSPDVVSDDKDIPAGEPEEELEPQDIITVHIMDSNMDDCFYDVGHKDLSDFLNKFGSDEFSYDVGGVFGSEKKPVNEGKPLWFERFVSIAKKSKAKKSKYYIDATNPKETIKEVAGLMRITYPDLIINF